MLRITETYGRTTVASVSGETISIETSNLGSVSQFVLALYSGNYSSGTPTASMLESIFIDIMLEAKDGVKIIDNCSVAELAGIADIEGGAVRYRDSLAVGDATGTYLCYMVLPLGNFVCDDETLRIRITFPAQAGTFAAGTAICRFGFVADGAETESGIWCFEKTTLSLTSGASLEKQNQREGVMATYLHDPSAVLSQFTIVPSDDRPSSASRELLRAVTLGTESLEIGVAVSATVDSWLKTFKVYECDALTAHTQNVTVRCVGSGTGNVSVINRYYHGRRNISVSNVKQLEKVAIKAAKLERNKPAIAKQLRHTGAFHKSDVYMTTSRVFSSKLSKG